MERKNIGAPSAQDVDTTIRDIWHKILQASITDQSTNIRPKMGDYVNLIIPQLRVTYSAFYSPHLIPTTYFSALETARRNVYSLHEELGFAIEEYRAVPSWSKSVCYDAFDLLKSVVYDSPMQIFNKGELELLDVDPGKKMFEIRIIECGECWGIPNLNLKACQYSAGTMAGVWSSMIGVEFGVFEKSCIANGDDSCIFVLQPIEDSIHYSNINEYISINPRVMYHTEDVVDPVGRHILNALEGKLKRPRYGDIVHLTDYQLRLLTILSIFPEEYSIANYHAGFKFGRVLAWLLKYYYKVWGQDIFRIAISKYYETLGFAKVESTKSTKNGLKIQMKEIADCAGLLKDIAPHGFLCGELAGIASEVLGYKTNCENTKCREGAPKICEFVLTIDKSIPIKPVKGGKLLREIT